MNNPHETDSLKRRGRPATGQAKTAAQRMQERRQRMKHGETGDRDKGGEREITVVLTLTALNALRRMAKRDGVTQKQFLDALLRDTEDKLLKGLDDTEFERYINDTGSEHQEFKTIRIRDLVAMSLQDSTTQPIQDVNERQQEDVPAATPSAEKAGISTIAAPTLSKYKGVSSHKRSGKYQAQIRLNGKPKHLGLFATPEEAAAAIDVYRAKMSGK